MRVTQTIRMPVELHEALHRAAAERGLSYNYLANRAVVEFLDRLIPADELRLTYERPDPENALSITFVRPSGRTSKGTVADLVELAGIHVGRTQ